MCKALGMPQLAEDPDYATGKARANNRDKLNAIIAGVTEAKTSAEWIDLLNKAGVPSGPIYKMNEVFADPQVQHLGMARGVENPKLGHQELVGQAVSLSRTNWALRRPTPERGEHTEEVLRELGYNGQDIVRFRQEGVV